MSYATFGRQHTQATGYCSASANPDRGMNFLERHARWKVFSEEEVAFILSNDIAETRRLADAAGRETAAEIATTS